ncbi:hypothetical protein ELI_02010 [Erythrobacter litoralis HTCC2594]|uniref:Uncharacterized protein n=1 Tax=Erythrobacter litoralis (strain HTCC2594) TaxID=314225 RepID=Q2NCU7_ERYLH|nr:hypothetical protein ELI_02010 [Erythrobacter litoralis HTCC2594]
MTKKTAFAIAIVVGLMLLKEVKRLQTQVAELGAK